MSFFISEPLLRAFPHEEEQKSTAGGYCSVAYGVERILHLPFEFENIRPEFLVQKQGRRDEAPFSVTRMSVMN